jgi:enoyl-CoA hydratase
MSTVLVERDDSVAVLMLNRPEKLNALNAELLTRLAQELAALSSGSGSGSASGVRCAILTGSGEKAFAAGADIEAMKEMAPAEALRFASLGRYVAEAIEEAPFPVIAAVNGFALGGGCELALACDFIYASEKAKLGQPEVNLGVIPGFGGTQRLARRIGAARARELCLTGDVIGADEALRVGLVNKVFPPADLLPQARETARKIASKGPLAIAAARRVLLRGEDVPLPTACELEATAFSSLFGSADQREGMAAFIEKRPARFAGK